MKAFIPKKLYALAQAVSRPLLVVGGCVRDFLAGLTPFSGIYDWDICSTLPVEELTQTALSLGFEIKACFKNTGALKLVDGDGFAYEYTRLRSDKYVRGFHTPTEVFFTEDITLDAKRRDFTANAVYYDIVADKFIDPLDGITAIRQKRLTTVQNANKVFGEDGLRLMRLARFAGQLGFQPDDDCLQGAKNNAPLIRDVSPERIFSELSLMLYADKKYGVESGHYTAFRILEKTRVLDEILPELALGRDMKQRADFHDYDVLEHCLRALLYADERVRLPALLHDVGKPFCTLRDGHSYEHPKEGARIAKDILTRLKAPKKTISQTETLVALHMYDFNGLVGENKLRKFLLEHYQILEELFLVKQADFSACKDNLNPAPTVLRWKALLERMKNEGVPFSQKQLAVTGKQLIDEGFPPERISEILHKLSLHLALHPNDNKKTRLLRLAKSL